MGLTAAEAQFLLSLQEARNPVMDGIMSVITTIGWVGLIPILICLFMLIVRRYRAIGMTATVAMIINVIFVNVLLKNIVARVRPYDAFEFLTQIGKPEHDFSFPSGHTASVFVVAFVIFLCLPKKVGIPAIVIAALVAFSRMYLGFHYPTDVIAAILIAFAAALFSCVFLYPTFRRLRICKKKKRRRQERYY